MAWWFVVASGVSGALAVALGAFGAHALKNKLGDYELGIWQTAMQYHLIHSVLLLAVALWMVEHANKWLTIAATSWLFGVIVFSGSLYALALSGVKILGAITPIGGLLLIIGWISIVIYGAKSV